MAKAETTFSFSISERGETTGEMYNWSFTAKKFLSIRDRLNKDVARRQFLGEKPTEASPDSQVRAEILSHLGVSLVETPKGWRDANNGLDLFDDNVIMAVYEKTGEGQAAAVETASKLVEEVKQELRKTRKKVEKEDDAAEPAKQE